MRINVGLAVLALLLSMSLWVLVINDQNPEKTDTPDIAIPVEIDRVPPGLVVMNTVEPVRFKIRAPKDKWSNLRAASFRASVDLSRLGPGIQAVSIIPEVSDPQVKVLEVVPSTASLRLEEIQERTVPVKVNLVGNVPFGYVYRTFKVEPEVVVVSGPASVVQSVQTASVDVRLEGVTVEVDSAFHPVPIDSSGVTVRGVQVNPQTVKVRLPVEQQVSYKQVGVRPKIDGVVAQGYWVESVVVEPSSVTVVGDPKVLAGINYLETVSINVEGHTAGVVQDVRIVVPQGISLVKQETIRVRVNISALQSSQTVKIAPRVINVDPRLRLSGVPAYLEVSLQGPAPIMQGLRVESMAATVDATGLVEGAHSLKPNIDIPASVKVMSVQPETVDFVLSPAPTATSPATSPPASPNATPNATVGPLSNLGR